MKQMISVQTTDLEEKIMFITMSSSTNVHVRNRELVVQFPMSEVGEVQILNKLKYFIGHLFRSWSRSSLAT